MAGARTRDPFSAALSAAAEFFFALAERAAIVGALKFAAYDLKATRGDPWLQATFFVSFILLLGWVQEAVSERLFPIAARIREHPRHGRLYFWITAFLIGTMVLLCMSAIVVIVEAAAATAAK
jgi:hypothetical protein